ncbi:P-loop containing nucleoside triphosphate hydrolase protein [Umbelopsis sp. PMI_123]|nr:P-loop containing nucleoside triphosphate hydrolase protein [Umbelopsis sp. PMI_123]
MEAKAAELAKQLLDTVSRSPKDQRYILGISGIPGSGKTTFVNHLVQKLNDNYHKNNVGEDIAIAVSMDGYHLPKAALDRMENPQEAHSRRGALFTFDPNGIIGLLEKLRDPANQQSTVKAPSFDHAKADPVDDDTEILPCHRIVIMEGIYLQLVHPDPWNKIPSYFDDLWFIDVDLNEARSRTGQRHYNAGLEPSLEAGIARFDRNDYLNAKFILANRDTSAKLISSISEQQ